MALTWLRNRTKKSQDIVDLISNEVYRTFTSEKPTNDVSGAVSRGISSSVPFIIALLRYSGGGKSYATSSPDRILMSALGYLLLVEISVFQVLNIHKHFLSFKYTYRSTSSSIHSCDNKSICSYGRAHLYKSTHCYNTHMVIKLKDEQTGY